MALITRNSFKGYVYQNYIFTLFLAKMDTERQITKIESETDTPTQFDDLYVKFNGSDYRIQVKNYPNTSLEDITISNSTLSIKGNDNRFSPNENNILVVNTSSIETNIKFMGFDAVEVDGIIIIPLTESDVESCLDEMFMSETRELQIIQLAQKLTSGAKFLVETKDLPELLRISTNLEQTTIILREPPDFEEGITYIVGKPGVGKSHYVNELLEKYNDSIIYRFWISSQDENIGKRLRFDRFIEELGIAIFKSSRKFTLDDLISEIVEKKLTIIIDGLDHVENYNFAEIDKYISFINSLVLSRVIVLSRPLETNITWQTIELENWTFDESSFYLATAHNITEYSIHKKIFDIANGYPIITFFLAEHYKLNKEINLENQLTDINEYYDLLLENVTIKTPLTIFATNNSFFLESELFDLLECEEMAKIILEFIKTYPYLFKKVINRVSLIHDSLNTYLRNQLELYENRNKVVVEKVKTSLLSGDIKYMSRLSSFNLDDDFYNVLLLKYCEIQEFENLLDSTLDYNSIYEFYSQLQLILANKENVLNVYQYYSFSLIYTMVCRNDLLGCESTVFQVLKYMKNNGGIEEKIFSSGVIWNLFLMLITGQVDIYKRFLGNMHYSDNTYDICSKIEKSETFFNIINNPIIFDEIESLLLTETVSVIEKRETIIKYITSSWIHKGDNVFYNIISEYLNGREEKACNDLTNIVKQYGLENMWVRGILPAAKYQLNELGFFGDKNIFRNKSLKNIIEEIAPNGSFETDTYVESFLRLQNHEQNEIDIHSVNRLWVMYYMRKDYSVFSLDVALNVFERQQCIGSNESIRIISKVMEQSEKGIRHLLTSYINTKDVQFFKRLIKNGFILKNNQVHINELEPRFIDCFDDTTIHQIIRDILSYNYARTIRCGDIENFLLSKHKTTMLYFLKFNRFTVYDVTNVYIAHILTEYDIEFNFIEHTPSETSYKPFDHGCIHNDDLDYILKNHISHLEISCFTDGWYSCLPFVEFYLNYDEATIKKDLLKIIHNSMFARSSDIQRIGNWHLLLGNIPLLVEQTKFDIDWQQLYAIFKKFLDVSLIQSDCASHGCKFLRNSRVLPRKNHRQKKLFQRKRLLKKRLF